MTGLSGHNGRGDVAATVCDGFLALADEWIARAVSDNATSWFRRAIESVRGASDGNALAAAIGIAPRRVGKADLSLTPNDRAQARALRRGLDPSDWTIDQLARSALMVASYAGDDAAFALHFDAFCSTAEMKFFPHCHEATQLAYLQHDSTLNYPNVGTIVAWLRCKYG